MNNGLAGMQSLCEDIIAGHGARKVTLAFVKDESNSIRGDARLFIGQCRIFQRRQANALSKELAEYRKTMAQAARKFLMTYRHRRAEIRSDLMGASLAWKVMASELKKRRDESAKGADL